MIFFFFIFGPFSFYHVFVCYSSIWILEDTEKMFSSSENKSQWNRINCSKIKNRKLFTKFGERSHKNLETPKCCWKVLKY